MTLITSRASCDAKNKDWLSRSLAKKPIELWSWMIAKKLWNDGVEFHVRVEPMEVELNGGKETYRWNDGEQVWPFHSLLSSQPISHESALTSLAFAAVFILLRSFKTKSENAGYWSIESLKVLLVVFDLSSNTRWHLCRNPGLNYCYFFIIILSR